MGGQSVRGSTGIGWIDNGELVGGHVGLRLLDWLRIGMICVDACECPASFRCCLGYMCGGVVCHCVGQGFALNWRINMA